MTKPLGIEKVIGIKPGEAITASGKIPGEAEFFKDHFPGFPVLPGVLALEMLRLTAEFYFRSAGVEDPVRIRKMAAVRFSKYLRPGDEWQSEMALKSSAGTESVWNGRLFHQGEVAVSARMTLEQVRTPSQVTL